MAAVDVQQTGCTLIELLIEPAPQSRAAFTEHIAAETKRWAQVVKSAKLAPQ